MLDFVPLARAGWQMSDGDGQAGLVSEHHSLRPVLREAIHNSQALFAFFALSNADVIVARNVLTDRLGRLVSEGILERRAYQQRPERFEYQLTEKGIDLWPVMVSLLKWGDRQDPAENGPPTLIVHRDCGGEIDERFRCQRCRADVEARTAQAMPGPGSLRQWPTAVL